MATPKSSGTASSREPASGRKQETDKNAEGRAEHDAPKPKRAKSDSASAPTGSNSALTKPVKISEQLAKVIGDGPMPRTEVTSRIWAYIRKNNLQNPQNKREILADEDLRAVLGQEKVTMFEMTKIISRHLT